MAACEQWFAAGVASLDDDPIVRKRCDEFVSDKPGWYQIGDGAKEFEDHPVQAERCAAHAPTE